MKAIILTIGDELLIGQVINTNAAYIAKKLNAIGIDVVKNVTVGDNETEILKAFTESFEQATLTVVTGGLGPTHDDITKKCLCNFFGVQLVFRQEVLDDIHTLLQHRSFTMTKATEEQALVPENAVIMHNTVGTAPGLMMEKNGKYLVAMPGVPFEMERMIDDFVIPHFRGKVRGNVILHRTFNTTGIGESVLAEQLGDLDALLEGASLAFLPYPHGVRLRVTIKSNDASSAKEQLKNIEARIRAKAEKYIYGVDDETLEEVIGKLLHARKLTLAIAESCTGGLIANRITNISGSSQYFERGAITYSNQSKTDLLDVPKQLIEQHGAVSKEVAEAMASGIRKHAQTDIGISTTGIAGPTGGTPEKPVGLTWIGYSDAKETLAVKFLFGNERLRVKERASQAALEILRRKILKLA